MEKIVTALETPPVEPRQLSQGSQVGGGKVGQRVCLQVPPQVLHRVEFRSISRQEFELDAGMFREPVAKLTGPMTRETVANDDEGWREMAQQLAQKIDEERSSDILVGMQTKIEGNLVPRRADTERSEHRNLLVRSSPLPQDGSLAAGSPATAHQGSH